MKGKTGAHVTGETVTCGVAPGLAPLSGGVAVSLRARGRSAPVLRTVLPDRSPPASFPALLRGWGWGGGHESASSSSDSRS